MGDKAYFQSSHYEDGIRYRLTCPYCGGHKFFYDPDGEKDELGFPDVAEMGDEITCLDCSRSFVISGNSYKQSED